MKRTLILIAILALAALPLFAEDAVSDDRKAIEKTIGYYFEGQATGSGDAMRKAFHPEAKLFWIGDGELKTRTSEEFAAGLKGKVAPDEAQR